MRAYNFVDFVLNEGAIITDSGLVNLSFENRESDKEVLKTIQSDKSHYVLKNKDSQGFKICYGLDYSPYRGTIDHPGRFKATMDLLKNGSIEDIKESIGNFLLDSYLAYDINDVDYIIVTESSKSLNTAMIDVTSNIFPEAKIIHLKKIEFDNPGMAINWDRLEYEVNKQSIKTAYRFMSDLVRMLKMHEDFPKFNPNKMKTMIEQCETVDEVKDVFYRSLKMLKWKEKHKDGKPLVPFKMRSSGFLSREGLRNFFYHKYDLSANDFTNAVIDCIMDGTKNMLFIDDNINTGKDTEGIAEAIDKAAKELGREDFNYRDNFNFYVLYSMSDRKLADKEFIYKVEGDDGFYSKIGKHEDFAKSFKTFVETGEYDIASLNMDKLVSGERAVSKYQKLKSERSKKKAEERRLQMMKDRKESERLNKRQEAFDAIQSQYDSDLVDLIADKLSQSEEVSKKHSLVMDLLKDITKSTGIMPAYIMALYYNELVEMGVEGDKDFWPFPKTPIMSV